jgi:hypothetical protein
MHNSCFSEIINVYREIHVYIGINNIFFFLISYSEWKWRKNNSLCELLRIIFTTQHYAAFFLVNINYIMHAYVGNVCKALKKLRVSICGVYTNKLTKLNQIY